MSVTVEYKISDRSRLRQRARYYKASLQWIISYTTFSAAGDVWPALEIVDACSVTEAIAIFAKGDEQRVARIYDIGISVWQTNPLYADLDDDAFLNNVCRILSSPSFPREKLIAVVSSKEKE